MTEIRVFPPTDTIDAQHANKMLTFAIRDYDGMTGFVTNPKEGIWCVKWFDGSVSDPSVSYESLLRQLHKSNNIKFYQV